MAINITLEQVKALLKTVNQTILEEKRSGNDLGTVLKLSNGCIINCWDKGTANCQGKNAEKITALLSGTTASSIQNRKVFVVYGHDNNARTQLEAMLRRWDLEPLILDQLISSGQTIIEKLEEYTQQANFGIVLATPDDIGYPKNDESKKQYRVRQNVVLELGMNDYTVRDKKNYGDPDVSKAAYPKFLEKLSVCRDLFHGFNYSIFMTGSDLDRAKTISGGVNFILGKNVAEHDLPDNEKTQNIYIKEALLLKQALSLCSSLVDEQTRFEAAYFESVRTMIVRLISGGTGKKFTLPEVNERINELLKHSIKSEGVINLFSDVQTEFSLFDPKFLEEVANMREKNLAVELLKKLIAEQVSIYRRTNLVKSEKFSEIIQSAMNRYLNGMLTNEEVIQELLKLAKDIADANAEGEKLGLTADELAFYDALTKPQAIKDFYEHGELIAITKELTDLLRKNRTIDWQKKESARAGMRRLVKRLLKKHKYPPEGMDDAVQTVMSQCEMWTDNVMTA